MAYVNNSADSRLLPDFVRIDSVNTDLVTGSER
jgi:hypothetical protein